ncbi:MAG: L-histidine N(alpha)-methyltransferase, partial [Rhizobacter sp.]
MPHPAHEIIQGLSEAHAVISPKYFYDDCGSRLFEQITRLPEYYPTRTEAAILAQQAGEIARLVGPGRVVIEPGAGNCEKARHLCRAIGASQYVGVDISADFLQEAVQGLRRDMPGLRAQAVGGDLTQGIHLPVDVPAAHRLVFYPGSSIGNFDRPQALDLLSRMRGLVQHDGALLIGVDLRKDVSVLEAAYDDAAGVTAEFNLNMLSHVNRLVG